MRNYWFAALVVIAMLGAPVPAPAQTNSGTAQITALLAQYPDGGPALRAAVARLVESDPSLAQDVVALSRSADPRQQHALGEALGDAASYFADLGSGSAHDALGQIESAMASAPPLVLAGFAAAGGPSVAQSIPGLAGPSLVTNRCVSPSGPGGTC